MLFEDMFEAVESLRSLVAALLLFRVGVGTVFCVVVEGAKGADVGGGIVGAALIGAGGGCGAEISIWCFCVISLCSSAWFAVLTDRTGSTGGLVDFA